MGAPYNVLSQRFPVLKNRPASSACFSVILFDAGFGIRRRWPVQLAPQATYFIGNPARVLPVLAFDQEERILALRPLQVIDIQPP
ncbi:MAG TPA: hypothetical protein ENK40_01035 [Gammaproteobacteria bacterium]|nr:hypothetical protein [Gammaproteobacteria bacterium]